MGRDWESNLYFPHIELGAARLTALLETLARDGLTLAPTTESGDRFPAMEHIHLHDGRPEIAAVDVEDLLRTRRPPLGAGYGVIALHCREPWAGADGAAAFVSFGRPDAATGLDSLMLTVDGAAMRYSGQGSGAAFERCIDWFTSLATHLSAAYGWGDWEDLSFGVALPTRAQVVAGQVPFLFRLNLFGPALVRHLDIDSARATAARALTLPYGGIVITAGLDSGPVATAERRMVARALGLQTPVGMIEPS